MKTKLLVRFGVVLGILLSPISFTLGAVCYAIVIPAATKASFVQSMGFFLEKAGQWPDDIALAWNLKWEPLMDRSMQNSSEFLQLIS